MTEILRHCDHEHSRRRVSGESVIDRGDDNAMPIYRTPLFGRGSVAGCSFDVERPKRS